MSNQKRREDKKRRREKRLARRDRSRSGLDSVLRTLQKITSISEPLTWPGAAHPSLDRPDRIKFEFALFAEKEPGRGLERQLKRGLEKGLLDFVPDLDHWGMEEFLWHGLPGNAWHPIDQYLQNQGDRFPEAARVQLAQWKQARIGCYEIGRVADDLVYLRELDVFTGRPASAWARAIALNIGGVNIYEAHQGQVSITYLAPWVPEKNIFCTMGYGFFTSPDNLGLAALLVRGMRNIEAVTFPLPWCAGKSAARECLEQWRARDWHQFMRSQLCFPFQACLLTEEGPMLTTVRRLLTETYEESQYHGLYFALDIHKAACGGTAILPLEYDSPNAMAFAEYRGFRRVVGPPPASRGLV